MDCTAIDASFAALVIAYKQMRTDWTRRPSEFISLAMTVDPVPVVA